MPTRYYFYELFWVLNLVYCLWRVQGALGGNLKGRQRWLEVTFFVIFGVAFGVLGWMCGVEGVAQGELEGV